MSSQVSAKPRQADSLPAPPPRTLPYIVALLLLPVLVLWRQDDALYSPLWQSDPWFYLGYFRDLVSFKRDLFPDFYYGSRLSWILPGFALHQTLPALAANAVLHLAAQSLAVLSLFHTLRRTVGLRCAYLTAMAFGMQPWFWAATGWDHVNGGAIAYYLLAMALLTRAAAQPRARWSLLGAGMAIAAAVCAHLYMVAFVPLLVLHYVALSWNGTRTPVARSLVNMTIRAGAGFLALTAPLCIINGLWVDGNFWFWTPSLRTAKAVTTNYIWTESLWYEHRLVPYLWVVAAAGAIALVMLPTAWKRAREGRDIAALLYSVQYLAPAVLMVVLQGMGITLLGHYYYACYLFPGAFVVMGVWFWKLAEQMGPTQWVIACCAGTLVFALPWISPPANPELPVWETTLLVGTLLGAALCLRRSYGVWLALAGLAALTGLTYTGSFHGANIHATRAEYLRVMANRRLVEHDRQGAPVVFWYDRDERAYHEYSALNSSFMLEFARIGDHFPRDCTKPVEADSYVVVTSLRHDTPGVALRSLSDCWANSGVKPVVQRVREVPHPVFPYTMVVLKAVEDFAVRRPLSVTFDGNGRGHLELVPNPTELRSLPSGKWVVQPTARMETAGAELTLRTPPAGTAYAFTYAPMTVPETGRYRFALRYKLRYGRIAFGGFPPDESRWLSNDIFGHRVAEGRELAFTVDLKAGDTILLRIANNNEERGASSFALLDTYAIFLAPSR